MTCKTNTLFHVFVGSAALATMACSATLDLGSDQPDNSTGGMASANATTSGGSASSGGEGSGGAPGTGGTMGTGGSPLPVLCSPGAACSAACEPTAIAACAELMDANCTCYVACGASYCAECGPELCDPEQVCTLGECEDPATEPDGGDPFDPP